LKAVRILGTGLISRCFDGVYVSITLVADEADGSGCLNLFDVDDESCGSVFTTGVTELFAMEKWSGITFGLRGKRPLSLNPEMAVGIEAVFAKLFK
jgi:hypothetical protein